MTDHFVVVTGSEGFLGRKVVERLAADGCNIIAVDRVEHHGACLPGVEYHASDLADPKGLIPDNRKSKIKNQKFILVHLAWDMRRHLGHEVQDEQVRQFRELLAYWESHGLKKLVAMGSAEEYGGYDGVISENADPVLPLSAYGQAKRSAHDFAMNWSAPKDIPVAWLRPFIIYGPGQRGDMMIPYAVACARDGKDADFTDGKQKRDFVYIDDVAEAIAYAVIKDVEGRHVINIGTGTATPVANVLMTIADHFHAGEKFHLGARPRRPNEPNIQCADCSRAEQMLGWKAKTPWQEGIRRTCDHTD